MTLPFGLIVNDAMLSLMRKKRWIYLALLALTFYAGLTCANPKEHKIGMKMARALVHEVLKNMRLMPI